MLVFNRKKGSDQRTQCADGAKDNDKYPSQNTTNLRIHLSFYSSQFASNFCGELTGVVRFAIGWGNGGGVVRFEPVGKRNGGGDFVLAPTSRRILVTM